MSFKPSTDGTSPQPAPVSSLSSRWTSQWTTDRPAKFCSSSSAKVFDFASLVRLEIYSLLRRNADVSSPAEGSDVSRELTYLAWIATRLSEQAKRILVNKKNYQVLPIDAAREVQWRVSAWAAIVRIEHRPLVQAFPVLLATLDDIISRGIRLLMKLVAFLSLRADGTI
mgnify:CR=1 FL=1